MRWVKVLAFPAIIVVLAVLASAQGAAQNVQKPAPKTAMGWFARASDRMAIRMPGSAPFHLQVTFHAYPGEELLGPKEAPQVITGNGTYDELWLSPHKWRREVIFAGYHAVEVESENGRKMQASSDYEPSRVLMLLNALLEPIPRNTVTREYGREGLSHWAIDHISSGNVTLVRISKSEGDERGEFTEAFYFTPLGLLLLRNEYGLATKWESPVAFSGRIVPREIEVQATRDRTLLKAEITIAPAAPPAAPVFDLPGPEAAPGETLRPLQYFEIKQPDARNPNPNWTAAGNSALVFLGVIDRSGVFREGEVILTTQPDIADKQGDLSDQGREDEILLEAFKETHWKPAEIDGSPCEFLYTRLYARHTYVQFVER